MMLAVMYGMIPSAKMVSWSSAPPENRLIRLYSPESLSWLRQVCTFATLTPGAGTCDPSRKIAMMNSTNSNLRRRSGVRKALANALSTRSSFWGG